MVQSTLSSGPNTSSVGRVYDDISAFLLDLPGSLFLHVYRETNVAAHKLAKSALASNFQVY